MAVLASGRTSVLRAWWKSSGAGNEFRTFRRRFLPVLAHIARFLDGRFHGVAFSPPLTCGAVECDIRPVVIWHSKTVQYTLFLANSDSELYESAEGQQRESEPCLFRNSLATSTRRAESLGRHGPTSKGGNVRGRFPPLTLRF